MGRREASAGRLGESSIVCRDNRRQSGRGDARACRTLAVWGLQMQGHLGKQTARKAPTDWPVRYMRFGRLHASPAETAAGCRQVWAPKPADSRLPCSSAITV